MKIMFFSYLSYNFVPWRRFGKPTGQSSEGKGGAFESRRVRHPPIFRHAATMAERLAGAGGCHLRQAVEALFQGDEIARAVAVLAIGDFVLIPQLGGFRGGLRLGVVHAGQMPWAVPEYPPAANGQILKIGHIHLSRIQLHIFSPNCREMSG